MNSKDREQIRHIRMVLRFAKQDLKDGDVEQAKKWIERAIDDTKKMVPIPGSE